MDAADATPDQQREKRWIIGSLGKPDLLLDGFERPSKLGLVTVPSGGEGVANHPKLGTLPGPTPEHVEGASVHVRTWLGGKPLSIDDSTSREHRYVPGLLG